MKQIVALLLLALPFLGYSQTITVNVTGVESPKGHLLMGVFTSDEAFDDEKPVKNMSFAKAKVKEGKLSFSFELEPGTYGLSFVDDENDSKSMDYNWMHIPEEGFGFSDYYLSGMSKPGFDDFKFTVKKGENKTVTVKMRYL